MKHKSHAPWTPEEEAILKEYYPIEKTRVYIRLPGRTRSGCSLHAKLLGLTKTSPRWSDEEDAIMQEYYAIERDDILKRLPGRTASGAEARARFLGIEFSGWRKPEDEILRTYYPIEGKKVVARLPGRTVSACMTRASRLGIESNSRPGYKRGPWSTREDDIIRAYYPTEGEGVSARLPARSLIACRKRINYLFPETAPAQE